MGEQGREGKRRMERPDYVGDDVGQTRSGTNAARLIEGGSAVSAYSQALVCSCQSACVLYENERGGGFKLSL